MLGRKLYLKLPLLALLVALVPFQNCSSPVSFQPSDVVLDAFGRPIYKGQLTVTPSKPNPPLKLFFVIDNSASMLGHQIDLGTQFSTLFQSASTSLQGFDTTIYVFSTASTFNQNYLSQIPTRAPSSISSVPAATDAANLSLVPGNIFGYWNNTTGTFGSAPFNMQISPAPVLDNSGGNVVSELFIAKKGSSSESDYAAQIVDLTNSFKSRLSYLNPTNQSAYENLTDVSSGLCTMARIVKHSSNYIQPGDSTAFIIASDDDDRMNLRNPNGNSCLESVVGSNNLLNGSCGHYQSNYNYSTSANISYYASRKFNYESGTNINYSYASSESCSLTYQDGYSYTSTYTALQTDVTYTRCDLWRDGTCITPHPNYKQTLAGNFVGAGAACTKDMTGSVDNPAPGATFTCVTNNLANQIGGAGVDTASNGSTCSSSIVSSLQGANRVGIACAIRSAHTKSTTASNLAIGSCANYCSAHSSSYPNCALVSTNVNRSWNSINLAVDGVTCSSTCPTASLCGSDSINSYILNQFGPTATCDTPTIVTSGLVVNAGADSSGAQLNCSSSLAGHSVTNSSGTTVCAGQSTVLSCINSLQSGTPSASTSCTVDNSSALTVVAAPLGDSCQTACANSNGYCDSAQYSKVADYLARSIGAYCVGSVSAGSGSMSLTFRPSASQNANCSSKCSDSTTGSCDGLGWGAADGSTVSDYISSQKFGGNTCSSSVNYVSDINVTGADAANPQASCAVGKFFVPNGSAYAGTATNYATGDGNHVATDFINYISKGSPQASIAVITQLPGDNLYGTSVGQQYINLATQMNSNQVSSILGNYSSALNNISDFIVKSAMNNFVLPLSSTNFVFGVSVLRKGTATWQPLDSSNWSVAGSTLTILSSVNLQIGDQLQYQYRLTQ